jgi:DNA-binding beta-propeller fold protein YncE
MNPAPPVTSTRSPIRRSLRGRRRGAAADRPVGPGPRAAALALAAVAALLAGCGGGSATTAPKRAAEPAESPPLHVAPRGPSVAVGREPEGIAWDAAAQLIAVGVRQPAQVVFVDPESLKVVRRVALPAPPRHLAYDDAAGTVLVPAESANELLVVRPRGIVTATKVGTHPHDATSVGGNVFVADEHSDQMTVLRQGHVVKTLHTPHQPGGIAAVSNRWVALVAVSARVLQTYGVQSLKPLGSVPAGIGPSHIVSRAGYGYVADTQGDQILVYKIRSQPRLVAKVAVPGTPYGLAIDVVRGRLWVTSTATSRLSEFKLLPKPKLIRTYPTLRQPNSVAVDERTGQVFVAGRDSGRIERITPPRKGKR